MHFSQNVVFGVPGQNISRTAGPNCMIFSELIFINKMYVLNELIYINKICVLNELDFHLKAEKIFFQTSNTKKCIFFYRGSVTIPHMIKKNSSEKSFHSKHTSTLPWYTSTEIWNIACLFVHIFWPVKRHYLTFKT